MVQTNQDAPLQQPFGESRNKLVLQHWTDPLVSSQTVAGSEQALKQ